MDAGLIIGIVIGALVIGAIILILVGLRSQGDVDPLEERLLEYAQRGETASD